MTALSPAPLRGLLRHRELALGLTRRELFSPFAGSAFGVGWALLHPLATMLVYVVVFSVVFRIRFGDADAARLDYTTYVLAGLLSWTTWATVLGNACSSVIGSASLVRQADFPSEVLPLRTVLAALVPQAVGLVVLIGWVLLRHQTVLGGWALLPVAIVLQASAMLGLSYALGALCVFARDAKEIVTVFLTMGVFLTPAFYTPDTVRSMPVLEGVLRLNPFTHFMHVFRDCLFWGRVEHPWSWVVVTAVAAASLVVGHRAFERLKIFFGNFL